MRRPLLRGPEGITVPRLCLKYEFAFLGPPGALITFRSPRGSGESGEKRKMQCCAPACYQLFIAWDSSLRKWFFSDHWVSSAKKQIGERPLIVWSRGGGVSDSIRFLASYYTRPPILSSPPRIEYLRELVGPPLGLAAVYDVKNKRKSNF